MRKGFSLIEMLVVMAIFMTMMLVVSDIFLSVSSSQKASLTKQRVMVDMQYTLEQVAQMIRLGQIKYVDAGVYALSEVEQNDELLFTNSKGEELIITSGEGPCDHPATKCVILSKDGQYSVLSPASFNVTKFDFIITPSSDPYKIDFLTKKYKSDQQPQVTILFEAEPTTISEQYMKPIFLQTTVSSRYYER